MENKRLQEEEEKAMEDNKKKQKKPTKSELHKKNQDMMI